MTSNNQNWLRGTIATQKPIIAKTNEKNAGKQLDLAVFGWVAMLLFWLLTALVGVSVFAALLGGDIISGVTLLIPALICFATSLRLARNFLPDLDAAKNENFLAALHPTAGLPPPPETESKISKAIFQRFALDRGVTYAPSVFDLLSPVTLPRFTPPRLISF